tara:strand:- start:62 stop:835 length:774 start_codon:yes stop_codon:yes gene_type:complete
MITIVITVKNRCEHFLQTFPSAITQYGTDYNILYVDFVSDDGFQESILEEVRKREKMFSPYLNRIEYCLSEEDLKFNPRKARNIGFHFASQDSDKIAFSDVDVFIGMDYLSYWSNKVVCGEAFVATRVCESRAGFPFRLRPEINYGNVIVSSADYERVRGFDEGVGSWGGDDDDLYHRLKLSGLREINPHNEFEAKQYSILHGDKLRLSFMENQDRNEKESTWEYIYGQTDCVNKNDDYFNGNAVFNKEILYSKSKG